MNEYRKGTTSKLFVSKPGSIDIEGTNGAQMALKMGADKQSYVQEMRIPWSFIYKNKPEIKAGEKFQLGVEFLWGGATGNGWPNHRYADNMQPGHTSREFFWSAIRTWGDCELVAKNNLPLRQYSNPADKPLGTIPVRLEIPADAEKFTIAIDNAEGTRVRNLAGDFIAGDFRVGKVAGNKQTVEVNWDGRDDAGNTVKPGTYKISGLSHKGLGAEYEMCFYNPGTPPWETADTTGSWGADHCGPLRLARAGDRVCVGYHDAEGGSGVMVLNNEGRKLWGEKRGASMLAADEQYTYAIPGFMGLKRVPLYRYKLTDGAYAAFVRDGKELPFELIIRDLFPEIPANKVSGVHGDVQHDITATGMAAGSKTIAIAIATQDKKGKLALLNKADAKPIRVLDTPVLDELTFDAKETLYTVSDGKVFTIDLGKGTLTPVATPGLAKAGAINIDLAGNLWVFDLGPDQQIKAYANGKQTNAIGKKGGRPLIGRYESDGMRSVTAVAADARGVIWAVEHHDYPRRVMAWDPKTGKLLKDLIGNTGYAGSGATLHETDPNKAYYGSMEFSLDRKNRTSKLEEIIWAADPSKDVDFIVRPQAALPHRFDAVIKGAKREYFFVPAGRDYEGHKLFMKRNGKWMPVAAISTAGELSGKMGYHGIVLKEPSGELAGLNAYDTVIWNDTNRDGILQRSECEILPATEKGTPKKRGRMPFSMRTCWGERMDTSDLSFYATGVIRHKPVDYTDDGAPIYSSKGIEKVFESKRIEQDFVPVPGTDTLLVLNWGKNATLDGYNKKTGKQLWTYPNPFDGVHGSHQATMPSPGMLIGPLKITGTADIGNGVGNIMHMRGNLGQDFLLTIDGLFIGAMFQDCRLPSLSLPSTEAELLGQPMEIFSQGGEPFNGWFGKHSDGKVRLTSGLPRQASMIMEVKGLDSVRRAAGSSITLTPDALLKADVFNQANAKAAAKAAEYKIAKIQGTPDDNAWKKAPPMAIRREGRAEQAAAQLLYNDTTLFVRWEMRNDKTPWFNNGKDWKRLFKSGDALDFQISGTPFAAQRKLDDKCTRILVANFENAPLAVLMKPKAAPGETKTPHQYSSPVITLDFDRVEKCAQVEIKLEKRADGCRAVVAIPFSVLGFKPVSGAAFAGDLGFISSDAAGIENTARTYWSNQNTNLVNDLPNEAQLTPAHWGKLTFE